LDITSLVNKFKNVIGAQSKVYEKLQPAILDLGVAINALDIVSAVDAFKSMAYPYTGIDACPP